MFARRAVSSVARRAVVARPAVPVRSFASSMRRCEFVFAERMGEDGETIGGAEREEMDENGLQGILREALV
jgi:hypothetical protein